MQINKGLDDLVRQRQEKCDHNYQDRMVTAQGTFCGNCGKVEK